MRSVRLLVILIAVLSCKSHQNSNDSSMSELEREIPISLVTSDMYGGTDNPEIQVIRKEEELKSFYAKINKTRKPGLPVPEIDFTKEMVIIYCTGKTSNPEMPKLYPVELTEEELKITSKPRESDSQVTSGTAVLLPFGLYKMPITDKEIVLEDNKM